MTSKENVKRPYIIGLTGSIGMGKSTVAQMFVDEDVPLFDADAEVHKLQAAGGVLVERIESIFPGTTGPNGVDRKALGAIVLGDKAKMDQLESIIHPAVGKSRMEFFQQNMEKDIILFDVPLLFETGGHANVDSIVVVSAPSDQQRERVLAREGMSVEKFESILKLQMPDSEKRKGADFVIENGGSLTETRDQVKNFVKALRSSLVSGEK